MDNPPSRSSNRSRAKRHAAGIGTVGNSSMRKNSRNPRGKNHLSNSRNPRSKNHLSSSSRNPRSKNHRSSSPPRKQNPLRSPW